MDFRRLKYGLNKARYEIIKTFGGREKAGASVSRAELQDFWRDPGKHGNDPAGYAQSEKRSEAFVALAQKHLRAGFSALEIGCNVGRNLEALRVAGARELAGIEISEKAVVAMREHFPDLARMATIHNAPVEDVIRDLPSGSFDLVYSMAVLLHIHPDSEWIFDEMACVSSRFLITVEFESNDGYRIYKRNYRDVFEGIGLEQVEEGPIEGLAHYTARVFRKIETATAET